MDPYNLAICFGPTLLPIPPDRDQVTFQASVNEIIKIIISHQEEIFPNDGGEIYDKIILDRSVFDKAFRCMHHGWDLTPPPNCCFLMSNPFISRMLFCLCYLVAVFMKMLHFYHTSCSNILTRSSHLSAALKHL